tara:strand:- start:1537 stop:1920 length:384 start_codon:yes stop_codon:yes gene_type:complete
MDTSTIHESTEQSVSIQRGSSMHSDMDLLIDMMPDESIVYNVIEEGQSNEYYQGHAEFILKNIDSTEHYFHFVNTILKDYHKLSKDQKQMIQDSLGIKPKIVEKVVVKEKIVYKQAKRAQLNTYDDY